MWYSLIKNAKFSCDADPVPSIKSGCSFPCLYDDFSSMLDDLGLVKMVNEPTRCGNGIDIFLTSNHTLKLYLVLLIMIL